MSREIEKYIETNLPLNSKPVYNQFRWLRSAVVAGTSQVIIPTVKSELVEFIWVKQISICFDSTGGAVPVKITIPSDNNFQLDCFNFRFDFNIYDFTYVHKGTKLTVICSDAKVNFSLGFLTVTSVKQDVTPIKSI